MSNPVCWSIEGVGFNTSYTSKVKILLPELNVTKSVTYNFHMNYSQGNHSHNILTELKIYLFFFENTISLNVDAHKLICGNYT